MIIVSRLLLDDYFKCEMVHINNRRSRQDFESNNANSYALKVQFVILWDGVPCLFHLLNQIRNGPSWLWMMLDLSFHNIPYLLDRRNVWESVTIHCKLLGDINGMETSFILLWYSPWNSDHHNRINHQSDVQIFCQASWDKSERFLLS